jgi:hypothetical protein
MEATGQFEVSAASSPGSPWKWGWMGPRAGLNAVVKIKISIPAGNRTPVIQSVDSHLIELNININDNNKSITTTDKEITRLFLGDPSLKNVDVLLFQSTELHITISYFMKWNLTEGPQSDTNRAISYM